MKEPEERSTGVQDPQTTRSPAWALKRAALAAILILLVFAIVRWLVPPHH